MSGAAGARRSGSRYRAAKPHLKTKANFSRWSSFFQNKSKFGFGPLSQISIADGCTPQIWKRIHIQKPSGVHTKIFLAGPRTPFHSMNLSVVGLSQELFFVCDDL